MSKTQPVMTKKDLYGDDYSSISTDEDKPQAKCTIKPAGTAPQKRMRLDIRQKLAAIKHFELNRMSHAQLAQWMKTKFKLAKEPERSAITKMRYRVGAQGMGADICEDGEALLEPC